MIADDDYEMMVERAERAEAENARLANDYNIAREAHDQRQEELNRAEAERDALVDWNRVLNEEMVDAGMQGGDRTTTLGNVRRLIADRDAWKIMSGGKQKIIAALEAERDALRQDAERYRWLRDNRAYVAVDRHHATLPKARRTGWTIRLVTGDDESMDSAIDAARAALGEG